jgi:hypothetical protein
MLNLLKGSVTSKHAERLEQIVIALIGIEIRASPDFFSSYRILYLISPLDDTAVLGVITILVDMFGV